ncbi:MAG: hypothetical protein ABI147_04880 [Acidobacteriaceae bacterium]
MNQSGTSTASREIARQLLVREQAARGPSSPHVSAAVEVFDKLRLPLSALMGVPAFLALFARALALAKRETGDLETVKINEDGTLKGLNGDTDGAGLVIIASFIALLVTFVGEPLTLRLLEDVWPALAGGYSKARGRGL